MSTPAWWGGFSTEAEAAAADATTPDVLLVVVVSVEPPLPWPREEDRVDVEVGGLGLLLVSRTEVGSVPT
jgi:hypothetical protein